MEEIIRNAICNYNEDMQNIIDVYCYIERMLDNEPHTPGQVVSVLAKYYAILSEAGKLLEFHDEIYTKQEMCQRVIMEYAYNNPTIEKIIDHAVEVMNPAPKSD